ncbi:hypothetical protein M514_20867 [Trichuris suis]|uniref:RNA-directed DNA polymerase n=1 Tax=Trichuris suis TaxID=68888 RepID=A0A085NC05_9BILA|nr:hypothetical protein M514_20867 [Trichuris suis]
MSKISPQSRNRFHQLTENKSTFNWDQEADEAFRTLKTALTTAPTLAAPVFHREFQLHTDASDVGFGAILEQDGHVISYTSRLLRTAERNYSTIEKECLALMFGVKQFRHHLLGRHFLIWTDHFPLQWLSSQKMEGRLARWAIALQEFDFTIKYRKGLNNGNADALSRLNSVPLIAAVTAVDDLHLEEAATWRMEQAKDPVIADLIAMLKAVKPIRRWPPLYRRHKRELFVEDDILYWRPAVATATVADRTPVAPPSLRSLVLRGRPHVPTAGHMGFDRTLARVRRTAFWPGFQSQACRYCESCSTCQMVKGESIHPPMQMTPIGRPWERIAVDILQLPPSKTGKIYVLTVQDYFTKWLVVRPILNQTAEVTVAALLQVFADFGPPQVLHSDQGRNFESLLLKELCSAFGIRKTRCSPYHPEGNGLVERGNRTIIQILRTMSTEGHDWEDILPYAVYAYNTCGYAVTGFSPMELMFLRPSTFLQLRVDPSGRRFYRIFAHGTHVPQAQHVSAIKSRPIRV